MDKTQLFENILNEAKVTDYDLDDFNQEQEEDEQAEYERLDRLQREHIQELIDFCQKDPKHNYIVTDVKSRYSDEYYSQSAKGVTFETIDDIYDYIQKNFPGQKCVKIDFDPYPFKGCREVRIINDFDD
jgi:hypothetical protein